MQPVSGDVSTKRHVTRTPVLYFADWIFVYRCHEANGIFIIFLLLYFTPTGFTAASEMCKNCRPRSRMHLQKGESLFRSGILAWVLKGLPFVKSLRTVHSFDEWCWWGQMPFWNLLKCKCTAHCFLETNVMMVFDSEKCSVPKSTLIKRYKNVSVRAKCFSAQCLCVMSCDITVSLKGHMTNIYLKLTWLALVRCLNRFGDAMTFTLAPPWGWLLWFWEHGKLSISMLALSVPKYLLYIIYIHIYSMSINVLSWNWK